MDTFQESDSGFLQPCPIHASRSFTQTFLVSNRERSWACTTPVSRKGMLTHVVEHTQDGLSSTQGSPIISSVFHEAPRGGLTDHPLDPLVSEEILQCSTACRSFAQRQGEDLLRFNTITLKVSVYLRAVCCSARALV